MATGIASVWMLNGCANPHAARPSSIRAGTPSAKKPVGASTGGRMLKEVRFEVLTWPPSYGLSEGRERWRRGAPRRVVESVMLAPAYRRGRGERETCPSVLVLSAMLRSDLLLLL
jgi:hypothetical protein